jgi:hypothetical protein
MDSNLSESGRNKSMEEAKVAKITEMKTKEVPTSIFITLAGAAIALSFGLAMSKKKKSWAVFVGQWAPTILLFGIYDKIVKTNATSKEENKSLLH